MTKKIKMAYNFLNIVTDIVLMSLTYIFSIWLWLEIVSKGATNISQNLSFVVFYMILLFFLYKIFDLYSEVGYKTFFYECFQILKVNTIAVISLGLCLYIFRLEDFSRGVLLLFFILSNMIIILKRWIFRSFLWGVYKVGDKNVLVVGDGEHACRYIENVLDSKQQFVKIRGYVSKRKSSMPVECLGNFSNLDKVLEKNNIDQVVIALEPEDINFISGVIDECDKHGAKVYIVPFYNDYFTATPEIEAVGNIKLMTMRTIPLDNFFNSFQKRLFDIVMSVIFIVLTSPIMLFTAIGVKLSSPGPIVFKQERVGRYKKNFMMYKFRSMRINDKSTTEWSKDTDPRKTKFGTFIRKTSLDEFLQFFNVLKGDMSLIGPRPELPFFVYKFKEDIPLYMLKHQVRPGITGWAQVNGYRGDTSIEGRIKCDMWYIENWNIFLDIKIVFMTVFGAMVNNEK